MKSFLFFSSRRRHTRFSRDWSSDVCSSDLHGSLVVLEDLHRGEVQPARRGLAVLEGKTHELAADRRVAGAVELHAGEGALDVDDPELAGDASSLLPDELD